MIWYLDMSFDIDDYIFLEDLLLRKKPWVAGTEEVKGFADAIEILDTQTNGDSATRRVTLMGMPVHFLCPL